MFALANSRPILWKRYKNKIDSHLNFINSLNPSIQFTVNIEQNSRLPFLDLFIIRASSGNLSFSIYRNPTQTNNYLKFNSNNPIVHKKAVAKSLSDRAKNLCSEENLQEDLETVKICLKNNGYTKSFIENTNRNFSQSQNK